MPLKCAGCVSHAGMQQSRECAAAPELDALRYSTANAVALKLGWCACRGVEEGGLEGY